MSPLGNGLGIVVTAAAGLAPLCQPLLHHIFWAVKEQHLYASTGSISHSAAIARVVNISVTDDVLLFLALHVSKIAAARNTGAHGNYISPCDSKSTTPAKTCSASLASSDCTKLQNTTALITITLSSKLNHSIGGLLAKPCQNCWLHSSYALFTRTP